MTFENETWLIETGDVIIDNKARSTLADLPLIQRLIYCVWIADYGMRNAGDLTAASDLYPDFQTEACSFAKALSLPFTFETFSLDQESLAAQYFERFDRVCEELKSA